MVKSKTPAKMLVDLVMSGTAKWAKQRKAEDKDARAVYRRKDVMIRCRRMTIKEAAYWCMGAAYRKASGNCKLPANARQIYYAARPEILKRTGLDTLDSKYFCQTLLTGYMNEYDTADWNVVWDDRGHIIEPYTGKTYGLGTLSVRGYLAGHRRPVLEQPGFSSASVLTCGPDGRFGAVLFIE